MSRIAAFLWWCWIIFLLSAFAVVLFPIAIFIGLMIPVLFLAFLFW